MRTKEEAEHRKATERKPGCASEEKRRWAVDLFEHGYGYTKAAAILELAPSRSATGREHGAQGVLRWRFPPTRSSTRNTSACVCSRCARRGFPGARLRKRRASICPPAVSGWLSTVTTQKRRRNPDGPGVENFLWSVCAVSFSSSVFLFLPLVFRAAGSCCHTNLSGKTLPPLVAPVPVVLTKVLCR